MNTEIISVGTELVTGQVLDTNAAWLARQLATLGIHVDAHTTVGDDPALLEKAIRNALDRSQIVLVTGGIGPTPDDITRQAVASALKLPLVENAEALAAVESFFGRLRRPMNAANKVQALLPQGSAMILNQRGTAPGIHVHREGRHLFVLPGVPVEMEAMFRDTVAPLIETLGEGVAIVSGRLNCFGMNEARVGELLSDLMDRNRNPHVGTTASEAVISVRVTARAESRRVAQEQLEADLLEVRRRLGTVVFGRDHETLEDSVARLLTDAGASVCTAESCTGGLLAKRLTDVVGASAFFQRGFVVYANQAKVDLLGVSPETLERQGATSEAVAEEMALGARSCGHADFGLSITGIAGPSGAAPDKPVGLVYVGLADHAGVEVMCRTWGDHLSRREIRDRSVKAALNMLRHLLLHSRQTT